MNTPQIIQALTSADRLLIEAAISRRFDIPSLIDPKSPNPVQHSLTSLVIWFDQPVIKAAIDIYISIFTRAAAYAAALDAPNQAASLKLVLDAALELIASNPIPPDPDRAEHIIKRNQQLVKEARLITAAINKLVPIQHENANRRRSQQRRQTLATESQIAASDSNISVSPNASSMPADTQCRAASNTRSAADSVRGTSAAQALMTEIQLLKSDLAELAQVSHAA